MKIVLATGIYPPEIGGPAQYAKNLYEEFTRQSHQVRVLTYNVENYLPTGVRHLYFFIKTFFTSLFFQPGFILVLDTFSVALPSVFVAKLLGRKIIIRTGGDFLWEGYVERTGDLVLLREFYKKIKSSEIKLNLKERIIFRLTKWTVKSCSILVFSTNWQKEIWCEVYQLDLAKCEIKIVENYFGEKLTSEEPKQKVFLSGGRALKLKNSEYLKRIFTSAEAVQLEINLEIVKLSHEQFLVKLKTCYAVILVSASDISPNLALDALRFNKPVILTQETGLRERLGEAVIWVDPENEQDIADKIKWLAWSENYKIACERAQSFTFTHSWHQIATEFLNLAKL